jgi:hypothetical protein
LLITLCLNQNLSKFSRKKDFTCCKNTDVPVRINSIFGVVLPIAIDIDLIFITTHFATIVATLKLMINHSLARCVPFHKKHTFLKKRGTPMAHAFFIFICECVPYSRLCGTPNPNFVPEWHA